MKTVKNPFGLHTVTPYIIVSDVRRLIAFLEQVFDASVRGALRLRENKSVQHAEVQIGDAVLMMGEPIDGIATNELGLYTYVSDCDSVYQKALTAGATKVLDVKDYPHGDRYGGVKDFAGNTWWIVSHIGVNN